MSSPYDTNYAYNRMKERNRSYEDDGWHNSYESDEYITFILERSIVPYWKEHSDLVPESEDFLRTMSKTTFASIAYKIGSHKKLTIGESVNLMNAIIALREGIPRPDSIELDIPNFRVTEEELRGRTHIRIPRTKDE